MRYLSKTAVLATSCVLFADAGPAMAADQDKTDATETPAISQYEGIKFTYIMAAVRRDRAVQAGCFIGDIDARYKAAGKELKNLIGKKEHKSLQKAINSRKMRWGSAGGCFTNIPARSFAEAVSNLEQLIEGAQK